MSSFKIYPGGHSENKFKTIENVPFGTYEGFYDGNMFYMLQERKSKNNKNTSSVLVPQKPKPVKFKMTTSYRGWGQGTCLVEQSKIDLIL